MSYQHDLGSAKIILNTAKKQQRRNYRFITKYISIFMLSLCCADAVQ